MKNYLKSNRYHTVEYIFNSNILVFTNRFLNRIFSTICSCDLYSGLVGYRVMLVSSSLQPNCCHVKGLGRSRVLNSSNVGTCSG